MSLTDAENADLDKRMLPLAEANVEISTIPSGEGGAGKDGNLPANATTERNSGGTTTMMTRRMTVYFQLVEIDGNRRRNVNSWSVCLAIWQSPPLKHRLDEHIV